MTREEAIETVDAVDYFGMSTDHKVELSKAFVNEIYNDFESRTCENCKHLGEKFIGKYGRIQYHCRNGYGNDICTYTNQLYVTLDFGCNDWKSKNE